MELRYLQLLILTIWLLCGPKQKKLAEEGLVAFRLHFLQPAVAPAGAIKPLFGTNPISFAWPRPGKTPVVYDMATASMAMGEVQVAKREGHKVPIGTGLTKEGKETTDPGEIADGGVLLPFGGYKGSAIAMMVELMAGALVGDNFSYETAAKDNNDGGPPSGGEFIIAISPEKTSNGNWDKHADEFFKKMKSWAMSDYQEKEDIKIDWIQVQEILTKN